MGFLNNLGVVAGVCLVVNIGEYWIRRDNILVGIEKNKPGFFIILNQKEQIVNDALMEIKLDEIKAGLEDPLNFSAILHFFQGKDKIEDSKIYQIIKRIPKGAAFGNYEVGVSSQISLLELTYTSNLYGCFSNGVFILHFFNRTTDSRCDWKLIKDWRKEDPNFNDFLRAQFTLQVDNPRKCYSTVDAIFVKFSNIVATITGLISYKPVLEEFLSEGLRLLLVDNVIYGELYASFLPVYDLTGKIYDKYESAAIYFDILFKFLEENPTFHGDKVIYYPIDITDNATMNKNVEIYLELKKRYGDAIAGFSLSSLERTGGCISDYLSQLLYLKEAGTKFFYHRKEQHWDGDNMRANLITAVLLGAVRIGYSNTLVKDPETVTRVKTLGIGLEVSPIASVVQGLVSDLKNHPACTLMNHNVSIVITSDMALFWDAHGLSFDWYMAFMAMADAKADLKFLKQLALNSLKHAACEEAERKQLIDKWTIQWNQFIDDIYLEVTSNEL